MLDLDVIARTRREQLGAEAAPADDDEPVARAVGDLRWEEPAGRPFPLPEVRRLDPDDVPAPTPVAAAPLPVDTSHRAASWRQWALLGGSAALLLLSLGVLLAVVLTTTPDPEAGVASPTPTAPASAGGEAPPRVVVPATPEAEDQPEPVAEVTVPSPPPSVPAPSRPAAAPPRVREPTPAASEPPSPRPPPAEPASRSGATVRLSENWGGGELTVRCGGPADRYALQGGIVRVDVPSATCRAFVRCDAGGSPVRVPLMAGDTLALGGCNDETPAPAVR